MAYKITTAWVVQETEPPWLLDAYDEMAFDVWGGTPDHFVETVEVQRRQGFEVRIVEITVAYERIVELFNPVQIQSMIES